MNQKYHVVWIFPSQHDPVTNKPFMCVSDPIEAPDIGTAAKFAEMHIARFLSGDGGKCQPAPSGTMVAVTVYHAERQEIRMFECGFLNKDDPAVKKNRSVAVN